MGGKKHLLLVLEDCTNHAGSAFSIEASDFKDAVMALIKDSKATQSIHMQYIHCDNVAHVRKLPS